ncbi:MAG TPA: bifunctional glutamate N-acetyltransferase/amino-acid acetyltransferase ArgJ [Vicinamibacterales bacterium]|nr:bifunctional glutamate N-acetyltransferase/amino-acid acetyltransferase ArgJ [Vicinamibacterales bacterium]
MRTDRIDGGITAPQGFRAAGMHCGIKASGAADLALVVSDLPASAAAVFTLNLAKAAPVLVSQDQLARSGGRARAIVTNSGCANACTGPQGLDDAREMVRLTAAALACPETEVLVASTGVIGVALKMDAVRAGVPRVVAALNAEGGAHAARAIMTTDPFPKEAAVQTGTDFGTIRVGGMAKGSGMIEPRMATMLGYLTTDATVDPGMLYRALSEACRGTFNAITVDGEPSTNDCVFALANGASGVVIDEALYPALVEALKLVAHELALSVVRGGEGATKLVSITVTGAATDADAWTAARAIANSPLVKTAVHGADPNWGRLIAAAGRSGAAFVLDRARVRIGPLVLFEQGRPFDERAPQAASYLQGRELAIEVDLGAGGRFSATVWTCDLSAEYVKINAEYRT